jgi:hypothetical protein
MLNLSSFASLWNSLASRCANTSCQPERRTEMQKRFQEEGYRSQRLWEYLIEQECCNRTFNNEFLSAWWRDMVLTPLFSTFWYVHMVISEVGLIPPSTEQIRGWGFHSKGWTLENGHFYQSLKKDLWTIPSVVELMNDSLVQIRWSPLLPVSCRHFQQ